VEKVLVRISLFISIILTISLSACEAAAAPTVDSAQVQASAVALANTMYAQTQAAIPPTPTSTDTSVPSPTPEPSLTPPPLITDTPFVVQSSQVSSSNDPCNGPLISKPAGASDAGKIGSYIKIVNSTKASVTVSLYLNPNKQGECGFVSYVIPHSNSTSIANTLPYGCYNVSAFINDPKKPSYESYGSCINITGVDKTTITVSANGIKVTGP
jgi:hypothetical protein